MKKDERIDRIYRVVIGHNGALGTAEFYGVARDFVEAGEAAQKAAKCEGYLGSLEVKCVEEAGLRRF